MRFINLSFQLDAKTLHTMRFPITSDFEYYDLHRLIKMEIDHNMSEYKRNSWILHEYDDNVVVVL